MSTGLQPHSLPPPDHKRRNSHYFFPSEDKRERREPVIVGLILSIIVHAIIIFGIPSSLFELELGESPPEQEEFEILLADPEEPVEPEFVETNRSAPENIPDNTNNFSARDQQAANEELPDELSEDRTPAREGIDDPEGKVISGELAPPMEGDPVPPQPEVSGVVYQQENISDPQEQTPLEGVEEEENLSEEGVGASLAEDSPSPSPVVEPIEGREEPSEDTEAVGFTAPADPRRSTPAPRPRLARALPGPVKRQDAGVSQTGYIGVDANFSQFGEYMERMVEAVSQHWHNNCRLAAYSGSGSNVVVEFRMTRDGRIRDLTTKQSTASGLGEQLVKSAIEVGDPYGPWTEDMVQILGDDETITFRFRYW